MNKNCIVLSLFFASGSLVAMEPRKIERESLWQDTYEQRGASIMCLGVSGVCAVLAGRQEFGHDFHWAPITVHGHAMPPLCPIILSPLCACVGATQLDYTPNHSCCCAFLRRAVGRRAIAQAPQVQKME